MHTGLLLSVFFFFLGKNNLQEIIVPQNGIKAIFFNFTQTIDIIVFF